MRATHGLNPFNLIQNMPYASPNLFQNHHADPASAALNPYAVGSRQLGFGCKSGRLLCCHSVLLLMNTVTSILTSDGMNAIFAPNWPAQPSIQNTTGMLIINSLMTEQLMITQRLALITFQAADKPEHFWIGMRRGRTQVLEFSNSSSSISHSMG